MFLKYFSCSFKTCLMIYRNKISGHYLAYFLRHIIFEPEIPVGDYAFKQAIAVNNRDTAYPVLTHQIKSLCNGSLSLDGDRIKYHDILGPFDTFNLTGLFVNCHVFVDNSNPPFPGNCNCQLILSYSIHSC